MLDNPILAHCGSCPKLKARKQLWLHIGQWYSTQPLDIEQMLLALIPLFCRQFEASRDVDDVFP
jgi:hypothetical protein